MNKLLVASEYTDPAFFSGKVCKNLEVEAELGNRCGLLLITKNLPDCDLILDKVKELDMKIIIHLTITGLGCSKIEPRVLNWEAALDDAILALSRNTWIPKSSVVLRIDPLIPKVSDFLSIEEIVKECSSEGITRCRTSVIDYYPFVREKFKEHDLPYWQGCFQPPPSTKKEILERLVEICSRYNMGVESCAENIKVQGLMKVGCANREEWAKLGLDLPEGSPVRKDCFCNVRKYDLLSKEPFCFHGCLYVYWGRNR